jgi:hypothetical protein
MKSFGPTFAEEPEIDGASYAAHGAELAWVAG